MSDEKYRKKPGFWGIGASKTLKHDCGIEIKIGQFRFVPCGEGFWANLKKKFAGGVALMVISLLYLFSLLV
ncbi:hypothetical protein C7B69_09035 [filamentous cyanobacterium Phorm 46]|nr:hypothetical protein C7B69_09035 [filamentous cyanobacterium Phorm 46]